MSWIHTEPATWRTMIAGSPQNCVDGCGQKIIDSETEITNAAGPWRRLDCVLRQWREYRDLTWGTEAEFNVAWKDAVHRGGYATVRDYRERPKSARVGWTVWIP